MSRLSILLSAPYMIEDLAEVRRLFENSELDLIIPEVDERLEAEELMEYAGEVDGAICGDDRLNREVLRAFAPRLKVISKWGTGIDSIDSRAAGDLGIKVCNTPGAFTEAVSDSVLGYMLAFARGLPWLDKDLKNGIWEKRPGWALHEKSLGVIGVGSIGSRLVEKVRPFGMVLYGNDIREIDPEFIQEHQLNMLDLDELLQRSDFVSVNCDLNPGSYRLLSTEQFSLMKEDSILINTARGPVVDEPALIAALEKGTIAGAALDVFEDEPLPLESPLRQMDNVMLAPHNANASEAARKRVHANTIRNLFLGLGLEPPDSDWDFDSNQVRS